MKQEKPAAMVGVLLHLAPPDSTYTVPPVKTITPGIQPLPVQIQTTMPAAPPSPLSTELAIHQNTTASEHSQSINVVKEPGLYMEAGVTLPGWLAVPVPPEQMTAMLAPKQEEGHAPTLPLLAMAITAPALLFKPDPVLRQGVL